MIMIFADDDFIAGLKNPLSRQKGIDSHSLPLHPTKALYSCLHNFSTIIYCTPCQITFCTQSKKGIKI